MRISSFKRRPLSLAFSGEIRNNYVPVVGKNECILFFRSANFSRGPVAKIIYLIFIDTNKSFIIISLFPPLPEGCYYWELWPWRVDLHSWFG